MFSLLILFVLSIFVFFISYQALKYGRTYWMAPTLSGFKKRKMNIDSKSRSYFVGITSLIFGIFLFLLFLKGLLEMTH
jgi:hypothetical protein